MHYNLYGKTHAFKSSHLFHCCCHIFHLGLLKKKRKTKSPLKLMTIKNKHCVVYDRYFKELILFKDQSCHQTQSNKIYSCVHFMTM